MTWLVLAWGGEFQTLELPELLWIEALELHTGLSLRESVMRHGDMQFIFTESNKHKQLHLVIMSETNY